VAPIKARVGLDPRARELPCDPCAAEKLTAEVFGHRRADDLAIFRSDGGAAVAIDRGGEVAAFASRRGQRIGPAAGRDETAFLQAVAAAAASGADGGGSVTMRVPGACASLLQAGDVDDVRDPQAIVVGRGELPLDEIRSRRRVLVTNGFVRNFRRLTPCSSGSRIRRATRLWPT
jgi:hypothetical protein